MRAGGHVRRGSERRGAEGTGGAGEEGHDTIQQATRAPDERRTHAIQVKAHWSIADTTSPPRERQPPVGGRPSASWTRTTHTNASVRQAAGQLHGMGFAPRDAKHAHGHVESRNLRVEVTCAGWRELPQQISEPRAASAVSTPLQPPISSRRVGLAAAETALGGPHRIKRLGAVHCEGALASEAKMLRRRHRKLPARKG